MDEARFRGRLERTRRLEEELLEVIARGRGSDGTASRIVRAGLVETAHLRSHRSAIRLIARKTTGMACSMRPSAA